MCMCMSDESPLCGAPRDQVIEADRIVRELHEHAIDLQVPALVVKSAFQTAAYAGYPNISFLVKQR